MMCAKLSAAFGLVLLALAVVGCDDNPTAPLGGASQVIQGKVDTIAVPVDTSRKDTVRVVYPSLFPEVDSLRLEFVSSSGTSAAHGWTAIRKTSADSIFLAPLDTGAGRTWWLAATGIRSGRTWWTLDSLRVHPDSSRRIVLDSFYRMLKVADTSKSDTGTTPVADSIEQVPLSELSGSPSPSAGEELGVFFSYASGTLTVEVASDGNLQSDYNSVLRAGIILAMTPGVTGTASFVDAYQGVYDNDSVSSVATFGDSSGSLALVAGTIYSRFRVKTLTLPAAKCTVDVALSLAKGTQTDAAGWRLDSIPTSSVPALIYFGSKRSHPTKSHFKIVIP